jgi:hypothetical protein
MESDCAAESAENRDSGERVNLSSTSLPKQKNNKAVIARARSEAKIRAQTPRSARAKSSVEGLVCRYCGSDDLAPSFKKRRDCRCRACFKKRYGAKRPGQRTVRTNRKAKAAKQVKKGRGH